MVEPKKFGRALGIGVRVASNLVRERAGQAIAADGRPQGGPQGAQPARSEIPTSRDASSPKSFGAVNENVGQSREKAWAAARTSAQKTRGIGSGARRFCQAVWGPLTHAGSVLWLEVTGLFFALFAFFFAQNLYRVRGAWKNGPEHSHFLLYCAITLIFFWFSSSSFLRAYKKNKKSR